ncbi:MAG: hypothetical protein GXP35_01720 [Actinobacteria bacterium]|nr:hypothetical protein [Actinomycetota bacterium]
MRFPATPQDGPARGRRRGPGGRRQQEPTPTTAEELTAWFVGSLPDSWFSEPIEIDFDRDEIIVTGVLPVPDLGDNPSTEVAEQARIETFREETRDRRMGIAERAQSTFRRKVSWATTCGESRSNYTVGNVPVMTRLLMDDRATLDTLIDAGVARSRSEALAWCVRLVADNETSWLEELRSAMSAVEDARTKGPTSTRR